MGCYGFRLEGLEAARLLLAPPGDWPVLRVSQTPETGPPPPMDALGPERAQIVLQTGGWLELEREPATLTLRLPRRRPDGEIVHPYLAPGASVAAHWSGRDGFHASAVVLDGGAWVVIGDKGLGKSSTVAWLGLHGHPVLTDDLLVVDAGAALAGPRCIDLRPDAARHLRAGEPMGVVGGRERWRLPLGPVPARVPIRGWIALSWGDRVHAEPVPPAERLLLLAGARSLRVPPARPEALVELSRLPAWRLSRPPGWRTMPAVAARIRELAAG